MLGRWLACAFLVLGIGPCIAQAWPTRPLTMIIPFSAGGPTDVLGRIVGERMSQILGQQVIIENVGGAGGMTGAQRVAQAQPDGQTFLLGTVGTQAVNQTLYKRPLYDSVTDFMPVALVAEVPLVLITRNDLGPNTLQEFIAYTKANQAKMNFASAGNGSAIHLGCLLLNAAMGTSVQHVPYRGSAPAMQDMSGGRIDFMCEVVSTARPLILGGSVKAVAMLGKSRSPAMPDLATADEQGLKGFEAYTWNAFFLPKGTPEPIATKLHDAVVEAMNTPAVRQRLEGLGANMAKPDQTTSEYLAGFVKSEIQKWAAPIKASGVSIE